MMHTDTVAARRAVRIEPAHRALMRRWAAAGYPDETCGPLLGATDAAGTRVVEVRLARNLEPERANDRYLLDPAALLAADRDARAAGLEIVGFWHSHPDSAAVPSETDRERAWPGYAYVIVSVRRVGGGALRAWRLERDTFHEERVIQ